MKKLNKYLSQIARNITPYQWEEGFSEKTLRFDANTMPFPPRCLKSFLNSMRKKCPINEYSDPTYNKLKELIASYEGVNKNMITVTNSGDEAIDILAKTFLDEGDYFIVTPPTYSMFAIQCRINKGKLIEVPLRAKTFKLREKEIIKVANKKRAKLVFLCNPNNPTGTVLPQKIIKEILSKSNSIVIVDEAYREFYGKSSVAFLRDCENLVILCSFSKFASIAGARVGYLVSNKFFSQKFDAIRLPMGVSYFSYKLAETILENEQKWIKRRVNEIKNERKRLTNELTKLGFYVFPSQTNFLLVKIGKNAKTICQKLKKKNIVIRDRSSKKHLDGCVRITIRSKKENNKLICAVKEVLYEPRAI